MMLVSFYAKIPYWLLALLYLPLAVLCILALCWSSNGSHTGTCLAGIVGALVPSILLQLRADAKEITNRQK
jgi:hypothetical protein